MVASDIFLQLLRAADSYLFAILDLSSPGALILFRSVVTLGLVIYGMMLIFGKIEFDKGEVMCTVVAISLAATIIESPEFYIRNIVHPLTNFVINTSSFFISSGQDSPGSIMALFNNLDDMFDKIVLFTDHLRPKGGIMDFSGSYVVSYVTLAILILAYSTMYICFLIVMCVSLLAVYILHVVSFFSLMAFAFKATRHFFFAWGKALLNYNLTIIFASIVMGIASFGINDAFQALMNETDVATGVTAAQVLSIVCWCMLAFVGLLKAQEFASAISGGMASGTSGVTAALSAGGGAALTSAKMGPKVPGGVAKGAGSAWSMGGAARRQAMDAVRKMRGL